MRRSGDRLRRAVRRVHLWLGLGLGGLLVLLGLTGTALAFYPELDAWMHPEIRMEGSAPPDWDRALTTLRAVYPDKQGGWRFEVTDAAGAIPVRYYSPPERAGQAFRPMMVWLSRDGCTVLRRDYWGEYAVTLIYDLHYRLLLGTSGGKALGWAGFALLALLFSGLWAWWPRGSWRKALRVKRNVPAQRVLRDWHKLAGLIGLPVLAILTVTGIMLELPKESDTALSALGLAVAQAPPVHTGPASATREAFTPPSQAVRAATRALPGGRVAWIETPVVHGGLYRLRLQVPGDPSRRFPHSLVWVDGATGAVVAVQDARNATPGSTINNWIHPLHDGSAAGLPGRVVVAISGLVPLALFATGWLRWRNRRAGRDRRHAVALRRPA